MPNNKQRYVPEGYHTVTPHLCVRDAARAIEFYKKAFGAVERERMAGPDGNILHAELAIGDSSIMMAEECRRPGMKGAAPQTLGDTTVSLHVYFPDVDAAFMRAVEAGATAEMPPTDMFWGDRYAKIVDPFGHSWGLATFQKEVKGEELQKAAREFFAKAAERTQHG